ncbi:MULTISPECIES: arginine repressor [unclassified Butyrivibrio]|jgi:transcriptional regulator of arginine metabolism|uniref:arginine repressor n=1 Tax=unclassified Butyrivibrio TaxID=2639466 RepID=UPI000411EB1B|nr:MULTISPECIES: arginine repressor [unclassified Butyrivibrio]
MKKKRHEKLIEMIQNNVIETQEQMADMLRAEGFDVTQATVSRDIRELRLTKRSTPDGKHKYVIIQDVAGMNDKYTDVLKAGFLSMDSAQNILVIRTVSGMAMAVAAALDAMEFEEVVGCIAGDDTIMAAIRTNDDVQIVMNRLNDLLSPFSQARRSRGKD